MSEYDFSPVVKNICSGIQGKRCRHEAEEELLDHLEETYERNLAVGKSESDAFHASVKSLGNTRVLSQQLAAVHAHSPAVQMKSALWLFIIGLILQKFHLNLFTGMKAIETFAGIVLVLISLFLMRTVNKKLHFAFIFSAAAFGFDIIENCVNSYGIENEILPYIFTVSDSILYLLMWFFAVYGFMEMDRTYCTDSDKKKPHLGFLLVYMPFELIVSCGLVLMNEGKELNVEVAYLFIITSVIYVFEIIQFVRLKNRLWDADARYGIDSWNKKSITAVCMAVAVSIVCPAFFMYSYAVKDTPMTELVIHDTDDRNAADEIRQKMLSLGMDEDVLELIPDSEVMMYKNAVYMTVYYGLGGSDDCVNGAVYNFYLNNGSENDGYQLRSVYSMELYESEYRAGFYYMNYDPFFYQLEPTSESDIFISVLQKQGTKFYNKEPINSDFSLLHRLSRGQNGFDFKAENNQIVLFAMSHDLRSYDENFGANIGLLFVRQVVPFSLGYNTVSECAAVSGNYTFSSFSSIESPFMETYLCHNNTINYVDMSEQLSEISSDEE